MGARKALIIGIDYYQYAEALNGCVNDAFAVKSVIERHADGTVNFPDPKMMIGSGPQDIVERRELKDAVRALFADRGEISLFYFAGHGYAEDTGGFLCAGDCQHGDDGFSLRELVSIAAQSPAENKIIILDSCKSGRIGTSGGSGDPSSISSGMTILTATTETQNAVTSSSGSSGLFTSLLVDALNGSAANLLGDVTPGSVYAHIDQSLGPWAQRPVFKTNVQSFVSLRKAIAPIPIQDLQALAMHFPTADYDFPLDPAYEPERPSTEFFSLELPSPDPVKTAVFATLQRYARVNLVRPKDAPHLWHAAMGSKSCELTVLGQYYRDLASKGLI
jgi:hypothetical protein